MIGALLADLWPFVLAGLGVVAAIFYRGRAKDAEHEAEEARRDAQTHKEMREHEKNSSEMSDDDLADKLTRR